MRTLWRSVVPMTTCELTDAGERTLSVRSGINDARVTGSSDGSVTPEFRGNFRLSGGPFFTGSI